MDRNDLDTEAAPGALAGRALTAIITLQRFEDARSTLMNRLAGGKMRRSHRLECLIRAIVLEFGLGRTRSIAHYWRTCEGQGSISAVRLEINRLVALRLVILKDDPTDGRAAQVVPTARLVVFVNDNAPKLLQTFEGVMR